ncbi:MAG: NAD-dependent epimerase/dehydratase family protein [Chitinophagaceae bacterium]|nr:NAD-dependent epimerase/dehydratase family protein [Chitinophagaceae bacterium]
MKKAGIIGGAGFIGSYITKEFLENGFTVKVSVTDISKQAKYQHLTELELSGNLYITEMKVENKGQLEHFVQDCDIVVHCGTPFQLEVKDPQAELFEPIVKGTENFLEVINKTLSVEKVVIVASVASYNSNFPMPPDGKLPEDPFDESQEKFMSTDSHPYGQAKYMANQVVDTFIKENNSLHFEISTVSPVMVFGKSLSGREDSTSTGMQYFIQKMIAPNESIKFFYKIDAFFAIVDVKDVAKAIYKTAITKGLHGKNYLLSSETWRVSDVNRMLNLMEPLHKPLIVYQNKMAEEDLGVAFKPVKQTLFNYVI